METSAKFFFTLGRQPSFWKLLREISRYFKLFQVEIDKALETGRFWHMINNKQGPMLSAEHTTPAVVVDDVMSINYCGQPHLRASGGGGPSRQCKFNSALLFSGAV